jgi:hypothetical protein
VYMIPHYLKDLLTLTSYIPLDIPTLNLNHKIDIIRNGEKILFRMEVGLLFLGLTSVF